MASPSMQLILTAFLQDLDPSLPLFFIMTSDSIVSGDDGSEEGFVMGSLLNSPCEFYEVSPPNEEARKVLFSFDLRCLLTCTTKQKLFERTFADAQRKPKYKKDQTKVVDLPVLPKADIIRHLPSLNPEQQIRQDEEDEVTLRELRISLRSILDVLFRERKYKPFYFPV